MQNEKIYKIQNLIFFKSQVHDFTATLGCHSELSTSSWAQWSHSWSSSLPSVLLFHTLCMVGLDTSAWECWHFPAGERSFSEHCISYRLLMELMSRNVMLSRISLPWLFCLSFRCLAKALAKFGSKSWMLLVMLKYEIGYIKNEGGY